MTVVRNITLVSKYVYIINFAAQRLGYLFCPY